LDRVLQDRRVSFGLAEVSQRLAIPGGIIKGTIREAAQRSLDPNVIEFGARADRKPRLFVAMPFADKFVDEYEIGFCEAAKASSFVCERLDLEHFTGDVVAEIKKRIVASRGV
jgi:hypothetical protein